MSRKSITFADKQDKWLKFVVSEGHYKDESDYVRDLVRRDEEKNRKLSQLKTAIQHGLNNGMSERSIDEIWKQAEDEFNAKRNG